LARVNQRVAWPWRVALPGQRWVAAAILVVGFAPWIAQASAQTNDGSGISRLRVINLLPPSASVQTVRLTIDGSPVVTALGFGASSSYISLAAGRRHIQIISAATGSALLDSSPRLAAGQDYTYSLQGLFDGSVVAVQATDEALPAAGRARVRFGNAIPNDLTVQARLRGSAVRFHALTFGMLSAYQDVPTGTYTLEIASPGGQLLLSAPNIALSAGGEYTLYSTGLNTASTAATAAQAGTVVVSSAAGSGVTGTPDASPAASSPGSSLQLVDLLPGALAAGPLKLTLDGQTAVGALGFGATTTPVPLTAGEHHLQVYRAASGAVLLDTVVTLQKNDAATYLLYRLPTNAVGGVLNHVRPASASASADSGRARVRFGNASLQGRALRAALAGGPTFPATAVGGYTAYTDVPAGRYTLQVATADGLALASVADIMVPAGQITTLLALDPGSSSGPGTAAVLALSPAGSQVMLTAAPSP